MTPAEAAAYRAGLEAGAKVAMERRHTHSIVEIATIIRALPAPESGAPTDAAFDWWLESLAGLLQPDWCGAPTKQWMGSECWRPLFAKGVTPKEIVEALNGLGLYT